MGRPGAVSVGVPDSSTRAMPKSPSLARPPSMKMFDGFTSRWTMPSRCASPSAARTSWPTAVVSATDSGPRASTASSVSPAISSMVKYRMPSAMSESYTFTTLGWLSRAADRASSRNRSAAIAVASSCFSTLTAMGRSRTVSRPMKTSPMPPDASSRSKSMPGARAVRSRSNTEAMAPRCGPPPRPATFRVHFGCPWHLSASAPSSSTTPTTSAASSRAGLPRLCAPRPRRAAAPCWGSPPGPRRSGSTAS